MNIKKFYRFLSLRFRKKRALYIRKLIDNVNNHIKILDLGGTEQFWKEMSFLERDNLEIWLVNIERQNITTSKIKFINADIRDLSIFKDKEFDIVFSNSTIEHLGEFYSQEIMAKEVRRLGKCYFVQTPNRYFFIEPHFVFPFFQFLPCRIKIWLLTHFALGFSKKFKDKRQAQSELNSIRLLSKKEIKKLFPDGRVIHERFLGFTKSFIVIKSNRK